MKDKLDIYNNSRRRRIKRHGRSHVGRYGKRGTPLLFVLLVGLIILTIILFIKESALGKNSGNKTASSSITTKSPSTIKENSQNKAEEIKSTNENVKNRDLIEQDINTLKPNDSLILVNSDHVLDKEFDVSKLGQVKNRYNKEGFAVNKELVKSFDEWASSVENAGKGIMRISSGFRDFTTQNWIFNNDPEAKLGYVQKAGASEHHTGLAVDIGDLDKNPELSNYLRETCSKFGFILRYKEDKESITKIKYEPWHFRFVGRVHADYMTKNNLCFEEYIEELIKNPIESFVDGKKYYVYSQRGENGKIKVPSSGNYTVSNTNIGLYIVTVEE